MEVSEVKADGNVQKVSAAVSESSTEVRNGFVFLLAKFLKFFKLLNKNKMALCCCHFNARILFSCFTYRLKVGCVGFFIFFQF